MARMFIVYSTIWYIHGKDNAEDFDTWASIIEGCYADAEEIDTPLSSVFIGGWLLCNLLFADDIDLQGGCEEELQQL